MVYLYTINKLKDSGSGIMFMTSNAVRMKIPVYLIPFYVGVKEHTAGIDEPPHRFN